MPLELTRRLDVGSVADLGLLDSAANRPRSTVFGTEAYPRVEAKVAVLLHSRARNHALAAGELDIHAIAARLTAE